ncbi:uncharacterized protein LOC133911218 [Phragmites australis]|uniref:uncharacterized protein LOC133911218 n=1 Tax=Phragmites australis TaxID=29695 RepID=UPI002D7A2DFF|nr:uncharacterized protein LOC133911218 [Phragmites australis]
MVRCTHALLLVLALACVALVYKRAAMLPWALHGAEPRGHDKKTMAITGGQEVPGRAAYGDGAAVGNDGVGPASGAAPRLKLARRLLLGTKGGEDSAAGPSCHSNNVHINCTPPSPH